MYFRDKADHSDYHNKQTKVLKCMDCKGNLYRNTADRDGPPVSRRILTTRKLPTLVIGQFAWSLNNVFI